MIEPVQQAFLIHRSHQSADNGLRARIYLMWNILPVGRVIGLCDYAPVTHNKEAIKTVVGPEGDQRGKFRGIHALIFRDGRQPPSGWPDRIILALRAC